MIFSTLPKKEIPEELVNQVQTNTTNVSAIQDDVAEIELQQTAQDTAISGNTTAIQNAVAKTETNTSNITALTARVTANENNITAIDGELETLQTTVGNSTSGLVKKSADNASNIASNTAEINKLKQSSGSVPESVTNRISALETTVGSTSDGLVKDVNDNMADISALQGDVAKIKTEQTTQNSNISTASSNASAALTKANAALPLTGGKMNGNINMDYHYIANVSALSFNHPNNIQALKLYQSAGLIEIAATDEYQNVEIATTRIAGVATPIFNNDAANKIFVLTGNHLSGTYPKTSLTITGERIRAVGGVVEYAGRIDNSVFVGCEITLTGNAQLRLDRFYDCIFNGVTTEVNASGSLFLNCIFKNSIKFANSPTIYNCYAYGDAQVSGISTQPLTRI